MDEIFFTKPKRSVGGFHGHPTAGSKTIVLGMMELDLATRKATGKCVLKVNPDRTQRTLKEEIQRHKVNGSLIFTDSFARCKWLSKPNSGFVHRAVNHRKKQGQFMPVTYAAAIPRGWWGCMSTASCKLQSTGYGYVAVRVKASYWRPVGGGHRGLVQDRLSVDSVSASEETESEDLAPEAPFSAIFIHCVPQFFQFLSGIQASKEASKQMKEASEGRKEARKVSVKQARKEGRLV